MNTLRTLCVAVPFFATMAVHAVEVTLTTIPSHCGLANGSLTAVVTSGNAPFTFLWSNGATGNMINGLFAGSYSVTVTDALGEEDIATATVNDMSSMSLQIVNERSDCDSACTGIVRLVPGGGQAPITMTVEGPSGWTVTMDGNAHVLNGLCGSQEYNIAFEDANGCPAHVDLNVPGVPLSPNIGNPQPSTIQVLASTPSCGAMANGSITFTHTANWTKYHVLGVNTATDLIVPMTGPMPRTIEDLAPDTYTIAPLVMLQDGTFEPAYCSGPTTVEVGALAGPCGSMQGYLFIDAEDDCIQGVDDIALPIRLLMVMPGELPVITDGAGRFTRALEAGAYTLQHLVADLQQTCPLDAPVPFTVVEGADATTVDVAGTSASGFDLSLSLVSLPARPGFPTRVYLTVCNQSAFPVNNVAVELQWNVALELPGGEDGLWTVPELAPYACTTLLFDAMLFPDMDQLGVTIDYSASVGSALEELDMANNTYVLPVTITGSYDPNDKQGHTSSGLAPAFYFLDADDHIDYTVRFQNTGTDTAFTVVVRDTIASELDITSLHVLGASHAFTPSFSDARTLVFTFNDILLPDSGADPLGSNGFIQFRLKPMDNLEMGDVLYNTAAIHFDFNEPIITNTTEHEVTVTVGVAEQDAPVVRLFPNPVSDKLTVMMTAPYPNSLLVLAADGRRVEVGLRTTTSGIELDVRSLPAGLYLLRIAERTARFIKQ